MMIKKRKESNEYSSQLQFGDTLRFSWGRESDPSHPEINVGPCKHFQSYAVYTCWSVAI